mmetsp:Transcript_18646/g.32795  ORF Transcript_18646/g.32795 Transcript_18646/m.32795 type:complete len:275 (-) Transcript_18646:73-897(-)
MLSGEDKVEARTGNLLLREGWEELLENKQDGATAAKDNDDEKIDRKMKNPLPTTMRPMNRLTNECLFQCASPNSISVGLSGSKGGKKRHIPIAKSHNKLRYIVLVRSTNRPLLLLRPRALSVDGSGLLGGMGGGLLGGDDEDDDTMENEEDLGSDDGYDNMYNPDPNENTVMVKKRWGAVAASVGLNKNKNKLRGLVDSITSQGGINKGEDAEKKKSKKLYDEYNSGIPTEREISSFPALFCLAIHAHGTKPDLRKILELDKHQCYSFYASSNV